MADNRELQSLKEQLIRIEERFISITQRMIKLEETYENDLKDIKKEISDKYVTNEQFSPIQKAVYSTIGTILIAIVTSLLTLIIKK